MKVDNSFGDEWWNISPPITPQPSRLFHLEPIGKGTCYVESLTSYVGRLAAAHSVLTGTLLAIEVRPMVKNNRVFSSLNSHSMVTLYGQAYVRALNGTQRGASQLVWALNQLTLRTDLQFLTMLPWAKVLPVLGLLKSFHAWCPNCYQEWLNNQQVIYSPLLWALQVVKICPYHHRPLKSQCPHCHLESVSLWRNSQPGFCLKCGGWLGTNCGDSSQEEAGMEETSKGKQEIWMVETVGELIAQSSQFPFSPPREIIKTMLNAYVRKYTDGNVSAFGRALGLSRYQILHWSSGTTIPNLEQLLKICYFLETTLVKFFQSQLASLSPERLAFLSTINKKRRPSSSKVTDRHRYEKEKIIEAMQLALEEEPPPSLTQLALRLGFNSYSSLTTCSKSLSAALTARAAEYQQELRTERIRNVLTSALDSDEYPPPSLEKIGHQTGIGLATFYSYFPILCHAISLRYKDYQRWNKKQIILLGCREVRELAPVLHVKGITPTVKNLRKFMLHPSALWHAEVIEVINEVRRSLK